MRGMTEKVPSFWMFAWTRSLMNRADRLEDLLAQAGAAAAPGARARRFLELRQRVHPLFVNRLDDGALGDADAAADRRALRHRGDVEARVGGRRWKQQMPALRREIDVGP